MSQDIADLALMSRRARLNATANRRSLSKFNQLTRRLRPAKTNNTTASAPNLHRPRSAFKTQKRLGGSAPRPSTASSSSLSLRHTAATEAAANIQTLRSIEVLSLHSIEPWPESIRESKLKHLPKICFKIDHDLKVRSQNSPLYADPTQRQSATLMRQLSTAIAEQVPSEQANPQLRKQLRINMIDTQKWQILLRKNVKSSLSVHLQKYHQLQKEWIQILTHVKWLSSHQKNWQDILRHRKIEKERNHAILKLGGIRNKNYSKKMNEKHARTYELLRQRAWIARLNVRTRQRGRSAQIVRSFLLMFGNSSRFSQSIKMYRWRVIICQRATRKYFIIREARLKLLIILWLRFEKDVLIDMEIDARVKDQQIEHAAKVKRMSLSMGIDVNVLNAQMKQMSTTTSSGNGGTGSTAASSSPNTSNTSNTKKPRALPVVRDVRYERQKKKQKKIAQHVNSFNMLLEEREKLIRNDIEMFEYVKDQQKWGSYEKKKKKKMKRKRTKKKGEWSTSLNGSMAPGMRVEHPISKVLGPLAAAKKKMHQIEQQIFKQKKMEQAKLLAEARERRRRGLRSSGSGSSGSSGSSNSKTSSGGAHAARVGIISRYKPLDQVPRRRAILNWLSKALRETWKFHEEKKERMENSTKLISIDEMKNIMKVEESNQVSSGVAKSSSALALALTTSKEKHPFLFPLFSEYSLAPELKKIIRKAHDDYIKIKNLRALKEKKNGRNALKKTNVFPLTSVQTTSSNTLRMLLGDELIHSISGFVNVEERERVESDNLPAPDTVPGTYM